MTRLPLENETFVFSRKSGANLSFTKDDDGNIMIQHQDLFINISPDGEVETDSDHYLDD